MSLEDVIRLGHEVAQDYPSPALEHVLSLTGAHDRGGELRNLIFAAVGPKPKIVLSDVLDNVISITEGEDRVLVYDRPLRQSGLTWRELVDWYAQRYGYTGLSERDQAVKLYHRLLASMGDNDAEKFIFATYAELLASDRFDIPALIPQVYLHYDPYARGRGGTLVRQRMDFLVLMPGHRRVVIELDGMTHYADSTGRARPALYAQMIKEDRRLTLYGYEVFRFGGDELRDRVAAAKTLTDFFSELLGLDQPASRH